MQTGGTRPGDSVKMLCNGADLLAKSHRNTTATRLHAVCCGETLSFHTQRTQLHESGEVKGSRKRCRSWPLLRLGTVTANALHSTERTT